MSDFNELHVPRERIDPVVPRPNGGGWSPFHADRKGMTVAYLGNRFSMEQPDMLWLVQSTEATRPVMLRGRVPLAQDDRLEVLDDLPHDLGAGVPLVKVRRDDIEGYIALETLLGETIAEEGQLWVARNEAALRDVVEIRLPGEVLYSTIRLVRDKIDQAHAYLMRISGVSDDGQGHPVHPLQAGSEAHRLGLWALAPHRDSVDRATAIKVLEKFFAVYGFPAATSRGGGIAWPYLFDFGMPWGTRLAAPWYSGYANSAMASAAACLFRLTGAARFRELALKATQFVRTPIESGGALYHVEDYPFVAEYVYRSPPIPNYRVCDGEMLSVVYLYDCAVLLSDSSLLDFVAQLGMGMAASLRFVCARDGLPAFGMDGQRMNPDYMWQLWLGLQLLANITKDRGYLQHARSWREAIPRSAIAAGLPV